MSALSRKFWVCRQTIGQSGEDVASNLQTHYGQLFEKKDEDTCYFNRNTVTSVKWQVLFDTPLLFDEREWRLDDEKGGERDTSLVTETTGKLTWMRSCSKHEKRGIKPIRVRLVDTTKEGRVRSRRVWKLFWYRCAPQEQFFS